MPAQTPDATLWARLSAPFDADEVELLPKPTRKDNDPGACNRPDRNGLQCGGWHGMPAIHLHYVGHAGVTDRLNSVDPTWNWEPMALTGQGTPLLSDGGMWIRLTVLGVTRIAFGDAAGKAGPNAVKEAIGDAIRNGAMRFGVGTYLWSKSEKAQALAARQDAADPDAGDTPVRAEQERPRPQAVPDEAGDPTEAVRRALVAEVGRLALAAGITAQVAAEWAATHDGQDIRQATAVADLELMRDDLLRQAGPRAVPA